nr:universal stress protein [uncultured Campylobacter sp.]
MKKVITCVDQNALAPAVRDYGIYVAKTLGAELVFIHVVEIPELGENFYGLAAGGIVLGENDILANSYGSPTLGGVDVEKDHEEAEAMLDEYICAATAAGVKASKIIKDGDFIDVIAEYKDEAEIFVLGIKGSNNEDVGFNASVLIKELHVPSLLVNKEFSPINSVLIAFDGTDAAKRTLEFIKGSKLLASAHKHVLHINAGAAEGERMLDLAREILGTQNATFKCIQAEVPADEIIKYRRANNLDLIATGAFTKGFFKKLFLGSVSEDILHNALVPVLVLS